LKKPTNRKERLHFIALKCGYKVAEALYILTDREVKELFELKYKHLKEMPNYTEQSAICIRCHSEVETEFNTYCCCGMNRAVYDRDGWERDIKDYGDNSRLEADADFIANGYQLN